MILYHAKLNSNEIEEFEFDNYKSFLRYIKPYTFSNSTPKKDRVYLFTYDENIEINSEPEILITDNPIFVNYFVDSDNPTAKLEVREKIYLQEYPSFQAAYDVALSMRETSALCYDTDPSLN
jgi:hypothetical protein